MQIAAVYYNKSKFSFVTPQILLEDYGMSKYIKENPKTVHWKLPIKRAHIKIPLND